MKYLRNHETPNERTYVRTKGYDFPPGTTQLNQRNFMTATSATLPLNEAVIISEGAPDQMGRETFSASDVFQISIDTTRIRTDTRARARDHQPRLGSTRLRFQMSHPPSRRLAAHAGVPFPGLQLCGVGVPPSVRLVVHNLGEALSPTASDAAHANAAHMRQHCNVTSMRDPRGKRRRGGSSRSPSASSSSAPKPGSHLASRLTSA